MNNSNPLPGDESLPTPEDRQRAVAAAFRNSKWATGALKPEKTTDEERALKRLHEATLQIFKLGEEIKNRTLGMGMTYDEDAMSKLVMKCWQDYTGSESKEALRFMLSTVCTGMMLEALKEL